ncbi:hypothetical protein ACFX2A_008167 [Malus domestica]
MPKKQEEEVTPSSSKNDNELAKRVTTKGSRTPSNGLNTPVFRYIPTSRRKNGQSPFETGANKADAQRHMDNVKLLKTNAVLPLTQLGGTKVARLPQGFIKALPKGVEPSFLPTQRTEEGFDPNAYKLMSKAGYDFASSSNHEKKVSNTINNKERDLTETQKKLKKHGYGVDNNKAGVGFTPNAPVKISSKAKNASTQHISVSIEQDHDEPKSTHWTSVFDRMNRSRSRMLSKPKRQSNTTSSLPRQSALERLEDNKKFSRNRKTMSKEGKLDMIAEKCDIRSSIPSRMKHQAILEVDTNGPLKDDTEEEFQDVFHITIQESGEDEIPEEDVAAAPPQLEDGGQSTVDDLKELNLGTKDEQKPIFVSALLSADEVDEYYQLLSEYKDVFAWTYKEMPGLDPVIAVHHLAVKPGTRPIKQTQRRYRSELIPQIEVEIDKLIEAGFIREMTFPCRSSKSWWTQPLATRHCHLWTALLDTIKFVWLSKMRN